MKAIVVLLLAALVLTSGCVASPQKGRSKEFKRAYHRAKPYREQTHR
jgi:hypothetical protein